MMDEKLLKHPLWRRQLVIAALAAVAIATLAESGSANSPAPPLYVIEVRSGATELDEAARAVLEQVVADFRVNNMKSVCVTGYDWNPSVTDHVARSKEMALQVANHLQKIGIQASDLKAIGKGDSESLTPLDPVEPPDSLAEIWLNAAGDTSPCD